jgi:hypothetical protein
MLGAKSNFESPPCNPPQLTTFRVFGGHNLTVDLEFPIDSRTQVHHWLGSQSTETETASTNATLIASALERAERALSDLVVEQRFKRLHVRWLLLRSISGCSHAFAATSNLYLDDPVVLPIPFVDFLAGGADHFSLYLYEFVRAVAHEAAHVHQVVSSTLGPIDDPRCRDLALCLSPRKLVQVEFEATAVQTCVLRSVFAVDKYQRRSLAARLSRLSSSGLKWPDVVLLAEASLAGSESVYDLVALWEHSAARDRRSWGLDAEAKRGELLFSMCAHLLQYGTDMDLSFGPAGVPYPRLAMIDRGRLPPLRFRTWTY